MDKRISLNFTLLVPVIIFLTLLATLAAIPVFSFGCTSNSNNIAPSEVYFPVQKEPQSIVLTASLQGKLTEEEGYLRISGNLIIWPYGYSVKSEKDEIWVYNEEAKKIVRVGDDVRLEGGVISASFAEEKIGQALPAECDGPYWLTGAIIE